MFGVAPRLITTFLPGHSNHESVARSARLPSRDALTDPRAWCGRILFPAVAGAPWVATAARAGCVRTAASGVNRGQDNDWDNVDDGAHRAPEGADMCWVLMRTDRSRTRGEPQCRYRQDEPTRSVTLQERNHRTVKTIRPPKKCAFQNSDTAGDFARVISTVAACLTRSTPRECEGLLSVRTSAVALPLACGRPDL